MDCKETLDLSVLRQCEQCKKHKEQCSLWEQPCSIAPYASKATGTAPYIARLMRNASNVKSTALCAPSTALYIARIAPYASETKKCLLFYKTITCAYYVF